MLNLDEVNVVGCGTTDVGKIENKLFIKLVFNKLFVDSTSSSVPHRQVPHPLLLPPILLSLVASSLCPFALYLQSAPW